MTKLRSGRVEKKPKKTPWGIIVEFPPPLVRLLAKESVSFKHVRALSDREVAIGAEMPLDDVRRISRLSSWDDVTISEMRRFCHGCRFDPFDYRDRNRVRAYSRNSPKFSYLKASPYWSETFQPLIRILKNAESF